MRAPVWLALRTGSVEGRWRCGAPCRPAAGTAHPCSGRHYGERGIGHIVAFIGPVNRTCS